MSEQQVTEPLSSNVPSIADFQQKALEVFLYFADFCKEHNLRYFVCGGCCIGAVRHKGFIPWDDDIDVFMPRPDYERMCQLWRNYGDTQNYTLCRSNEQINYHDCGMLLKDNNSTFIQQHSQAEDIHHGYMMDIIPLDGGAPHGFKRKMQKLYAAVFSLFNAQRLPDNQGKKIRALAKIAFALVPSKKMRYKLWRFAEKKMSQYDFDEAPYITELVTGFRYMKNEYPPEVFAGVTYLPFEHLEIAVPQGYDTYLRMAFGDYMQLPPKEKRVPKHQVAFVDLQTPYTAYKGIHYCQEQK